MPVFISYSHSDKVLVTRLAAHMIKRNAQVWVDTWELSVGDSIIQRVQEAITSSDALLVVLSKTSVQSEWCKKEITSGLIRELEEKRVIVLPVIIEDCDIPLFLRDKLYADCRHDFESGIDSIMDAIARVTNPNQSRFPNKDDYTDWAIDWGDYDGLFHLRFTIVASFAKLKMTLLTEVTVLCSDVLTARQRQFADAGLAWIGRMIIAETLFEFGNKDEFRVILDSQFPQRIEATIADPKIGAEYLVIATCRKLGEDNGKDQLVNISDYLRLIREYMRRVSRKPTSEEQQRLIEIVKSPFGT